MTKKALGRLVVAFSAGGCAAAWCVSCDSPGSVGGSADGKNDGAGGVVINMSAGTVGAAPSGAGGVGVPTSNAGNCGSTTMNTTRAQADVLIVLDRTDSMKWSLTSDQDCSGGDPRGGRGQPSGTTCTSRLSAVVPAVGQVVDLNPGINWGLEFFLSPGAPTTCVVDPNPQVAIGPDSAPAIKQQLANYTTDLSTPTAAALIVATNYMKTVDDGNSKAILLATDGEPNCAEGSREWTTSDMAGATAAAKAASDAGFPVYVIGIGPSTSNLSQLAQTGGTSDYYPATSPEELSDALTSIAKVVSATCTFKGAGTPPDKSLVYVYVDKQLVNQGSSDGWIFDPADPTGATITLTGKTCADMMAGVTSQVQIVFGCPDVPPLQVIP
jgi:hypothetical protein